MCECFVPRECHAVGVLCSESSRRKERARGAVGLRGAVCVWYL